MIEVLITMISTTCRFSVDIMGSGFRVQGSGFGVVVQGEGEPGCAHRRVPLLPRAKC